MNRAWSIWSEVLQRYGSTGYNACVIFPRCHRTPLLFLVALLLVTPASWGQESRGSYFREIRQAVTDEDEERLFVLARADPWAFREVTNRLADLALNQTLDSNDRDAIGGYNRFVVAGLLASIYLQVTEDRTLADRLRFMRDWTPADLEERRAVDELMARADMDPSVSVRDLEKSVTTCRRLQDERCVGMLHGSAGSLLERGGHPQMAGLHYEKAAEAFRHAGELPRLRDALLARGQLLLGERHYAMAADALGAAGAIAEAVNDPAAQAGSLLLLGEALVADGRLSQALAALARSRDVALAADLPVLAARAIVVRTGLRDAEGPMAGTATDYEVAARLAEKGQDRILVSRAYLEAARAHAAVGDPEVGAADIEKALAAARLAGFQEGLEGMLLLSAEFHGRIGDVTRALRRVDEAITFFRAGDDRAGEARANEQKGSILLEAERLAEARPPLAEAVRLARDAGDLKVEGRAEGGLAVLALIAGNKDEARQRYRHSAELLEKAGDSFQAMRMRHLLEAIETPSTPEP